MRRCAASASVSVAALPLSCCCVRAACLYLLQVLQVFAKLLHLTWLNIPLSTYYIPEVPVATASGRWSQAIPMSSRIARRCPLNVLRLVDAVALAVAVAGHSFLWSQWVIPVSALVVCSTLTCRINVSGYNVVVCCTARNVRYFLRQVNKNSTNARYLWWNFDLILISIDGAFNAILAIRLTMKPTT